MPASNKLTDPAIEVDSTASSPLSAEEMASLRRLIQRAKGFALAFVRSNVPIESQRIVSDLEISLTASDIEVRSIQLGEPVSDLQNEVTSLNPPLGAGQALFVTGFERSIPSGEDFPVALESLNLKREHFRELPCPVVFVLPDYALDLITRKAPDFWAWRSGVFETKPIARRLDSSVLGNNLPINIGLDNLSSERKWNHLKVMRLTLADLEAQGPGSEVDQSELSSRIAILLESLGEQNEATRYAQAALVLAGNNPRARASALDCVAEIHGHQGDIDAALRIYQEDLLPAFEKLGDTRRRAVTYGRIADILSYKGELEEALRIYRDVQIPIFEEFGDARSRAVTYGRIADILRRRGQLDEALRIYREKEIPVYEELGDTGSRALRLSQVADILKVRGDLDEALRIWEEDVIPVFESLGDVQNLLFSRTNLALGLRARNRAGDRQEANALLQMALKEADRLRIPKADEIRDLISAYDSKLDSAT